MILSTVRVEDFERFWNTFSTKGAEKRKQHGSKGSQVFRDPNDDSRVWVLFDWDEEGYTNLLSDPGDTRDLPGGGARRQAPDGGARASARRLAPNLRCPLHSPEGRRLR